MTYVFVRKICDITPTPNMLHQKPTGITDVTIMKTPPSLPSPPFSSLPSPFSSLPSPPFSSLPSLPFHPLPTPHLWWKVLDTIKISLETSFAPDKLTEYRIFSDQNWFSLNFALSQFWFESDFTSRCSGILSHWELELSWSMGSITSLWSKNEPTHLNLLGRI